ncbi:MAG: protein kinase domain-containing protein, partial [Pseudonocardiaceae bacterium]
NVLLVDDGGVQITDFGVGVVTQDPAYRAPEVARGETATPAADVFSLGATLFMAAEGAPPFGPTGADPTPALPTNDEPTNDEPLGHALSRMLSADPALRPTMTGVEEALTAMAEGRTPSPDSLVAPPPAPARIARRVPPVTRRTHSRAVPAAVRPTQPTPAAAPPPRARQPPVPPGPVRRAAFAPAGVANASRTGGSVRVLIVALAVLFAALAGALFTELFLL